MTGYVADLSWKSGARAIEKLDRLRSTMAVNVLIDFFLNNLQDTLIIQIYSVIKLYMFQASSLSIIRSFIL